MMAGCVGGEASHLPPLWQMPGAAAVAGFENVTYGARRNRVKSYIRDNENGVLDDIMRGGGVLLDEAINVARVGVDRRAALIAELRGNPGIYLHTLKSDRLNIEAVTVALMVYGD